MRDNIRFSGGISTIANPGAVRIDIRTASAWGMGSHTVANPSVGLGFVNGDPLLDFGAKGLEAEVSVVIELVNDFGVQEAVSRKVLDEG